MLKFQRFNFYYNQTPMKKDKIKIGLKKVFELK